MLSNRILDLSNFNTSNVINMELMFGKCSNLKVIDGIYNFDTSKVVNMSGMFLKCNELTYLDLSKFNTSKVIYMNKMFEECFELEFLDISNFDVSNVITLENMFYQCHKLKEIKLINKFNINKTKMISMKGIFEECNPNINLNLIINNYTNIFQKAENIKKLNTVKQLITVKFKSSDQLIDCSLSCYNTDDFITLEEKLFEKHPELKHKDINYLANGGVITRQLTVGQNKIKNNTIIIIVEND